MNSEEKILSNIYDKNILNIISNRKGFNDLYNIFGSYKIYCICYGKWILTAGMKWSFEDIALICDLSVLEVKKNYYEAEKILKDCWHQAKYFGLSENVRQK